MRIPIWVFFTLFTVSGFAGLIYESIWSHYLKLFLGHAAYAQTLVLGIFMGGMALGSWLIGRYSSRIKYALLGYAIVELLIGLLAILFHGTFTGVTEWAFDSLMPMLGTPWLVGLAKWILATALIFPASVLLGATFPLMSSGVMRVYGDGEGRCLPVLYFTNSLGAALGVLASGFVLIERFGLPGTMFTAGLINICLALVVGLLGKSVTEGHLPFTASRDLETTALPIKWLIRVIYLAAFATGAASFMFEVAWIRMLSMAIGASTHSFEVMLSAFILGIALGGLALAVFGSRIRNNLKALMTVLAIKCLLALLAVAAYPTLLDVFQWLFRGLSKTENGYALYLLGSYGIASLMMIPTAFCAGMTLPLATKVLLEHRVGEKAIGQVYAANTVGAIVGTFAATHIGMELFGVKGITGAGALLELTVAVAILVLLGGLRKVSLLWPILPAMFALPAYSLVMELDQLKMASGVFRFGEFLKPRTSTLQYHQDGKTATVSVVATAGYVEIRTNGKTDASLARSLHLDATPDEHTMHMAAVLPYLYVPKMQTVANIGFGSGLTTHAALGNPNLRRIDSIEIEASIVEGAKAFAPANDGAYTDPRSHIHIDDAKTFMSSRHEQYDVIISEPSNPWISGVATLFSEEFYRHAAKKIRPGGVLVQWVQLYDTKPYLVASILKALGKHFSDYVVYLAHDGDAIIIATPTGSLARDLADPLEVPAWKTSLNRLGYSSASELGLLRVATRRAMEPLVNSFAVRANSDYFPVVDLNAPKERFVAAKPTYLDQLGHPFVPLFALLQGENLPRLRDLSETARGLPDSSNDWGILGRAIVARDVANSVSDRSRQVPASLPVKLVEQIHLLRAGSVACAPGQSVTWVRAYEEVGRAMGGWIASQDALAAIDALSSYACAKSPSETEASRIALVRSILARDPVGMEAASAALLHASSTHGLDADVARTALHANLAAKIARSDRASARSLVAAVGTQVVWTESLLSQALIAHALSGD